MDAVVTAAGGPVVGFVGLGNIGKPMALRLVGRLPLHVHDVAADPVAELVAAGATEAASVAELAGVVDVLCVMVRDDAQTRDVVGEALTGAREGLILLVHSTIAPATAVSLAQLCARHRVGLLDAPVSGGAIGAAEGSLALLVGGSESDFAVAEPVLRVLGSQVVYAGPAGSGTRMKLARNLLHFVAFTAATEAQRLAEAAGLSLADLGRVVRHTDAITGGPGAIMHRDSAATMAADDPWRPIMTHVVALGEKDLRLALEMATELGVELPLASLAEQRLAKGLGL